MGGEGVRKGGGCAAGHSCGAFQGLTCLQSIEQI